MELGVRAAVLLLLGLRDEEREGAGESEAAGVEEVLGVGQGEAEVEGLGAGEEEAASGEGVNSSRGVAVGTTGESVAAEEEESK